MNKTKEIIVKLLKILLGFLLSGIGTAMMYDVHMGTAPPATIIEGVARVFNVSYSVSGLMINGVLFLVVLVLDKSLINIGTLLSLGLAIFIDVGIFIMSPFDFSVLNKPLQIVVMVVGAFIAAFGVGVYLSADIGVGAIDAPPFIIERRTKLSFTVARWIVDASYWLIGVLMGASWGAGTIVMIVIQGPVIQWVFDLKAKREQKTA